MKLSVIGFTNPNAKFQSPVPEQPQLHELMSLDVGSIYVKLQKDKKYGLFPLMAGCSIGQIGALNAESFCERLISVGNLIQTKGNTAMYDDMIKMLVILRMNKGFMEFMSPHYSQQIVDHFDTAFVPPAPPSLQAAADTGPPRTEEEEEEELTETLGELDLPFDLPFV